MDAFGVLNEVLGDYENFDRMAEAIANGGEGWKSVADPPAGHGPRHSE